MARSTARYGEVSGKAVAAIAARGVKKPSSLTLSEIKAVCASVLTQAPSKKPPR